MLRLILVASVVSLMTAKSTIDDPIEDIVYRSQTATELLQDAQNILKRYDAEYTKLWNTLRLIEWNYSSNMTDENFKAQNRENKQYGVVAQIVSEANDFPWRNLEDELIKRQFEKCTKNFVTLPVNESWIHGFSYTEVVISIPSMSNVYNTATICDFTNKNKCNLGEYEIEKIMSNSRDPEKLKYTWMEWRKAAGEQMKSLYPKYVEYVNVEARRKNFSDKAAYLMDDYETDDFPEQIETLWQQIRPLYLQLHAYVRRELRKKYGEDIVSKDGPIPAHLSTWSNIAKFAVPFPNKQLPNVTRILVEQGYNATSIFRLAENFFKSINLSAMPHTFWEKSILEKQKGVNMSCTPMAWNFFDDNDFRILQCTNIDMENLLIAHQKMAQVEYFMQYNNQPVAFKKSAHPSFHEAVAELISLSVSTPGHLKKIGLLEENSTDPETSLNRLYLDCLSGIDSKPSGYVMDRWRWDVFQRKVTPDNYNCHWWSLATEYQGIEPPVDRSEEDFDPGAFRRVIGNFQHMTIFLKNVIKFQFHKALCIEAKQYDPNNSSANPLHQCDIYGNKDAGNLLKSMLELGSSKPWPDAMEKITGQRKIDAGALLEYFQPLMDWLTEENNKTNEYIGWKPSNKRCVKTREELRNTNDEL